MEPRSLKYITAACGGELTAGSSEILVRSICTDTRQVQAGDLFLALKGDRFDGHDYVSDAAKAKAAAVIVDRKPVAADLSGAAVILVDDTRHALGRLASVYRREFSIPLVAIGGSNGKTTTKDLLSTLLSERFCALSSAASFNNDIGVPLTLLKLEQAHQAGVLEVGTNHPGELAPLVGMIQPKHGIITSIGREHLEFFGNLAGVAKEEGRLAELLPAEGTLFINGDTAECQAIIGRTRARVVTAGFDEGNLWRAKPKAVDEAGQTFHLDAPDPAFAGEYRLPLFGRHQIGNVLLAIAAARELGIRPEEARSGLAKCQPSKMRLQLWKAHDVQVLDDSYNANADSVRAALQTLRDFPCRGRRVAILGDMAELGEHGPEAHAEVGRHAAEMAIDHLFAIGGMASIMARAASAGGLKKVTELSDVGEAAAAVKNFVRPGDVVLLKASRTTRLERVAEVLRSGQ